MSHTSDDRHRLIGERIRLARRGRGITQERLAQQLGFADRQTLSAIESGERRVSADELIQCIDLLKESLDFFTDPDLIVEENFLSYRALRSSPDTERFERRTRKLLELNRRLRTALNEIPPPTFTGLRGLTKGSPSSDATPWGERFCHALELGDPPARSLRPAVEEKCHVLVLELDVPSDISGAACHLHDGDAIMLNRRQAPPRRNDTLGHEFFHLLTWTDMPPANADLELATGRKPKVEKFAEAFTAGLLMPSTLLQPVWESTRGDDESRVEAVARHFEVSGKAAHGHLINCRLLRDATREIERSDLAGRENPDSQLPKPLAASFVSRLHHALADGRISAHRAASLLEMDQDEMISIIEQYGLPNPL